MLLECLLWHKSSAPHRKVLLLTIMIILTMVLKHVSLLHTKNAADRHSGLPWHRSSGIYTSRPIDLNTQKEHGKSVSGGLQHTFILHYTRNISDRPCDVQKWGGKKSIADKLDVSYLHGRQTWSSPQLWMTWVTWYWSITSRWQLGPLLQLLKTGFWPKTAQAKLDKWVITLFWPGKTSIVIKNMYKTPKIYIFFIFYIVLRYFSNKNVRSK